MNRTNTHYVHCLSYAMNTYIRISACLLWYTVCGVSNLNHRRTHTVWRRRVCVIKIGTSLKLLLVALQWLSMENCTHCSVGGATSERTTHDIAIEHLSTICLDAITRLITQFIRRGLQQVVDSPTGHRESTPHQRWLGVLLPSVDAPGRR